MLATLTSLSEHQLLVFWVQLLVLVAVARLLGGLMRKIDQPAVVGELAAGLILGPSVFGKVWPGGFEWFLPHDRMQDSALLALSWVGVALLLVLTGLDTDLGLIRRFGRAAAFVATGSLVLPFLCGLGVGWILPARFMAADHSRVVFALFIATALSISSLPVIAKILSELNLMRRNFGQINLAAGMANDTVGWLLLGVISGLAASGTVSAGRIGLTLGGMALFLVVAFTIGQRAIDVALRTMRARREGEETVTAALTVTVLAMVAFGAAAQALKLEAVLGAFVAGIVLGRSRFRHDEVRRRLDALTSNFLAPIFFATAGLRIDLGVLKHTEVLWWGLVILGVASIGKFAGAFAGATAARLSRREGIALGAGLNARGAVEVIIATVGFSLGVLNDAAYTAIVLMAMVTSIVAPPTLRLAVRNWRGSDEERERLEREEALERNLVVKGGRILLPSRGLPNSITTAQVLHFAWPVETPITVLRVVSDGAESDVTAVLNVLDDRIHDVQDLGGDHPAEQILAQAKLGYGVIALGVSDEPSSGKVLSAVADDLLVSSTLPLVIVRRARNLTTPLPPAFTRALVPASGTASARAAQEIAFNLSANLGTEVLLAHVIDREHPDDEAGAVAAGAGGMRTRAGYQRVGRRGGAGVLSRSDTRVTAAERVLGQAQGLARDMKVEARTVVRGGASAADELIAVAEEEECDLIVLGASPRRLEGRPFLGHLVEEVLARAEPTVVVVALPAEHPS